MASWDLLSKAALKRVEKYGPEYKKRLKKEFKEINKQGANDYWVDLFESKTKFDDNKNGLVFPFLLQITPVDPIKEGIGHEEERHPDFPDIDIDFLPESRASIKKFIADTYGEDHICSVGNWVTFKPKSALQDVFKAHGGDFRKVLEFTSTLPDDFDDLSLDQLIAFKKEGAKEANKYDKFYEFYRENKEIVEMAYKVVGMMRYQSTHAGGVIISDKILNDIVPMARSKADDNWRSQWTEGKSTQLSKFGLIKFDILGLKTMYYIWKCCEFIKSNRGIEIDWSDMDPDERRLGWITEDGEKKPIMMDDKESVDMINSLNTESIFQHETPIQKGIIDDGKVRDFWDLVAYSSLGRPGPMDMIPTYIKRRDGKEEWKSKEDPRVVKILEDTHGVITFQEQLTKIWMQLANFTLPQAEESRKIISKKWLDKLPKVKERWLEGATQKIGKDKAEHWWNLMESFGRYAFNQSHAIAYSIISFRCLYLKAHFGAEWWAAVMSICHRDKLNKYMGVARQEEVQFGAIDCDALDPNFTVNGEVVNLGLNSIKGIGDKASRQFSRDETYESIHDFIEKCGKHKTMMDRLIKLGAFDKFCDNRNGLWMWYLYKHGTGGGVADIREKITKHFMTGDDEIEAEINRQKKEYFNMYPNRKKVPNKIQKWKPKIGHRYETPNLEQIVALYPKFTLNERLAFEKEYLGYYWTSPMEMYQNNGETIELAKEGGRMEVVIEDIDFRRTSKGNEYIVLTVTDGVQTVRINVWGNVYGSCDSEIFNEGVGIRLNVEWNDKYNNFNIADNNIIPLERAG